MADFKTHMLGAALVSGVAATLMEMVGAYEDWAIIGYFALGVAGGVMPDIDSDNSVPIRIAFKVLSIIAAFLTVFYFSERYSLLELVLLGSAAFVLVYYGVFRVFTRFTAHRGVIHSIPAGVVAGLLTAILAHEVFAAPLLAAWTCAAFVCGGFLVHLILDELYSVDLLGARIKRSFGTALNFGSLKTPLATGALYLLLAALFTISPPFRPFFESVTDAAIYGDLMTRLVPKDGWFQGFLGFI